VKEFGDAPDDLREIGNLSLMPTIPIGTKGELKLLVTSENAINFLGLEGARVLSTPRMIAFVLSNAVNHRNH
jgi:hypothetical protein